MSLLCTENILKILIVWIAQTVVIGVLMPTVFIVARSCGRTQKDLLIILR